MGRRPWSVSIRAKLEATGLLEKYARSGKSYSELQDLAEADLGKRNMLKNGQKVLKGSIHYAFSCNEQIMSIYKRAREARQNEQDKYRETLTKRINEARENLGLLEQRLESSLVKAALKYGEENPIERDRILYMQTYPKTQLSPEKLRLIIANIHKGGSGADIARRINVSYSRAYQIIERFWNVYKRYRIGRGKAQNL